MLQTIEHVGKRMPIAGLLICIALADHAYAGQWQPLFTGNSLEGWAQTGPGYFELDAKEKCLITRGGMGMLWYYYQQFDDFSLRLEWKVESKNSNSGVFVRFPNVPAPNTPDKNGKNLKGPWGAVNEGYEVQIHDSADPKHRTGSIYTFAAPSEVPTKPAGKWNTMLITVVGPKYTVKINGKKVNEFTGDRSLKGYIGIQNHSPSDVVRFRDIAVKKID